MAIQLNEEIRDEARKMSEYVVEDTKRTVEMLQWLKSKQAQDSTNILGDAVAVGSAAMSGKLMHGIHTVADIILPRLRDRLEKKTTESVAAPTKNDIALNQVRSAKNRIIKLRDMISSNEISAIAINDVCAVDDLCYDAIIDLMEAEELL